MRCSIHRPDQVWDAADQDWYHRTVPAAVTVTAADMLATGPADAARSRVLALTEVDQICQRPTGGWMT